MPALMLWTSAGPPATGIKVGPKEGTGLIEATCREAALPGQLASTCITLLHLQATFPKLRALYLIPVVVLWLGSFCPGENRK
jgi:hypothetical protein